VTHVPATAIIVAGVGALIVMCVIPAVVFFVTAFRSGNQSKFPTVLALIVWIGVTVVLSGAWFNVAVAAHSVDDSLTYAWVIANACYPVIGIALVLIHHRVSRIERGVQ
jgi:ABC-type sulfate transport system permease subunit